MIKQTTLTLTDFQDTTVKGAYDTVPEINYPLITILEIQNTENAKFTDIMENMFQIYLIK